MQGADCQPKGRRATGPAGTRPDHRDALKNIIVRQPGTMGYERPHTVILHGHIDMVCRLDVGVAHDFVTQGVELKVDYNLIRAEGETLGAQARSLVDGMFVILVGALTTMRSRESVIKWAEEARINLGVCTHRQVDAAGIQSLHLMCRPAPVPNSIACSCAGRPDLISSDHGCSDEPSGGISGACVSRSTA